MIQTQEWKEWAKHPVTLEFFNNLKDSRNRLAQMLVEGQFTSDSIEATALKHAEIVGIASAIADILKEYQEEMADE